MTTFDVTIQVSCEKNMLLTFGTVPTKISHFVQAAKAQPAYLSNQL